MSVVPGGTTSAERRGPLSERIFRAAATRDAFGRLFAMRQRGPGSLHPAGRSARLLLRLLSARAASLVVEATDREAGRQGPAFFMGSTDERKHSLAAPHHIPRLSRSWKARGILVVAAALWGIVVDANLIPILAPTTNSTIFQASTAASFALIGILFGPLEGALAGLLRDGSIYLFMLLNHHGSQLHGHGLQWSGRAAADILEDVVLGLIPGLVGLRTRHAGALILATGITTWASLPLLVMANTAIAGHIDQIPDALTTRVGDWDEPVDPGLLVYALLTAGLVALAVSRGISAPRFSRTAGWTCCVGAALLMLLGSHS